MSNLSDTGFQLTHTDVGTLVVSGVLNFETAAQALERLRLAVADQSIMQIDLAGVRRSDSAGLSCMLALKADSVAVGRSLQIIHLPEGMRALAQVCEVESLIA